MAQSRAWAQCYLANAAGLPVSFKLDGKPVRGIPKEWRPVARRRILDANIVETVFEGSDPATGLHLRVECAEYRDYPVVEWVAWFGNQGQDPTPVISDILALDGAFAGFGAVLWNCNGDFCNAEGYTPRETPLPAEATARFAPNGGRPCDGAFPYYRLVFQNWGLALAIGWPAQWAAQFKGVAAGVEVRAGQEKTSLRLLPGERIRTPRMTILAWAGDSSRAVNLWRRWYLAHVLPRPNGQPMRPCLACAATDEGEEFTAATEENQVRYIGKFIQHGIHPDVWWIDAGWYPCYNEQRERKWWLTGTWEPDPERFPRGLKPISDCAARAGADLLVWFEPERVVPGSKLDREHPEWLLKLAEGDSNRLLYLGNPACRQWFTDYVCELIRDNGIKIYRQDHNFSPLEHWRKNDAPDRQGMNENLHVQGYLQFWDDLLARNPGLWIDSCASGGRRNDLETMRRSVPLHYTDFGYGDHPVKLAFHRTLYEWIPYFKECTLAWDLQGNSRFDHAVDSYSYHCGLAPMLFATVDIRRDDYDFAGAGKMIAIWRRAAGLILQGDYYQHTPFHRSPREWVAWQFDCPETGRGLVQGIRLPEAPQETITIQPRGIDPDAKYCFENPESGETREIPGKDLINAGFTLALPPRSGAIWFYRKG
jgi:alpha-galactosidase